ncbi:MAG: sigma-54-dependent transcriptional regulator [Thermoanaerobaculia bacterium]
MERILLVDDEPSIQLTLGDALADEGYEVSIAGTLGKARQAMVSFPPSLVLCDVRLPDGSGISLLQEIKSRTPELPVIMLTGYATIESAVDAMKAGADEYLTKPYEQEHLLAVLRRSLEIVRLRNRVDELEAAADRPVGRAPSFLRAIDLANAAARSECTVLLLGETGSGKEVFAQYLHRASKRARQPFVAVNCAALPENLLESELFGHEKGAFTGAIRQRRGRFEDAHRGTLLLDEVAEMATPLQAKLLRVLEEQTFERLGSNKPIKVDVRIIAATRRNLEQEVAAGRFRDDLYFRLRVVPITIPPLRERPGDVELLVQHFVRVVEKESGVRLDLTPETIQRLAKQPWRGNVRELAHLIRRLAVIVPSSRITPAELPDEYGEASFTAAAARDSIPEGTLAEILSAHERAVLQAVVERFNGHRGHMADALGISRKNLWEKLRAHGLNQG